MLKGNVSVAVWLHSEITVCLVCICILRDGKIGGIVGSAVKQMTKLCALLSYKQKWRNIRFRLCYYLKSTAFFLYALCTLSFMLV